MQLGANIRANVNMRAELNMQFDMHMQADVHMQVDAQQVVRAPLASLRIPRREAHRLATSRAPLAAQRGLNLRLRVVGAVLALAACHAPAPEGPSARDAIVVVRSNVADAQVYVDGRFVASLDALRGGIALEPGHHRIELRREDYFSAYAELTVARATRTPLSLELAAVLP
jgi:hypothetical protein